MGMRTRKPQERTTAKLGVREWRQLEKELCEKGIDRIKSGEKRGDGYEWDGALQREGISNGINSPVV